MHLKYTELNTEFINILINYIDIPSKYITKSTYTNHSTQIYHINTSIVNIFFQRFLIAKKNTKFAHLFIRNNIPFHTRIRGRITYHAYINKLTPQNYKPYFNNLTKTHELKTPNKHNAWFHLSIPILPSDFSKWKLSYETNLSSKHNTSTRLNPSQITTDRLPSKIITDPVLSINATEPLPSQTTTNPLPSLTTTDILPTESINDPLPSQTTNDPLLSQDSIDQLFSPLQPNNTTFKNMTVSLSIYQFSIAFYPLIHSSMLYLT